MQPSYYGFPYTQSAPMAIDRVSNLEEAKKYQVYPGSTVYLLDQDEPYIYLKVCDNTGKSNIRAFSLKEVDITKMQDSKYITRQDFDLFKKDILNVIKGGMTDAQSITTTEQQ